MRAAKGKAQVAYGQECNTPHLLQDAVYLASSRIYVQNLIQFGNSS